MSELYRMRVEHFNLRLSFPIFVFLVIPFFKPGSLEYIAPLIDTLFDYWLVAASLIIGFLYLASGRLSKIMLAIIAFEVVLTLSTVLNAGDYYGLTINIIKTIPFCMLIELGIRKNPKALIKALITVLGIECAINSVTILIFPDGMYKSVEHFTATISWSLTQNFFLGYDNVHILYILPLFCSFLIYAVHENIKRRYKIIFIVLFSATVYITWSAASVVSVTVFVLLFMLSEFHLQLKILKFRYFMVAVIVTFFAVIVFRIHVLLEGFIVGILGKSLTLSGRTFIWDRTINYIIENPILGIGRHTRGETYSMIGAPHTHSFFLRVAYESGLIGVICFLFILFLVGKSLKKFSRNKDCFILSATLFCFFIVLLTESFDTLPSFFGVLVIAYHIRPLTEGLSRSSNKAVRRGFVFGRGNLNQQTLISPKHDRA